MRKFKREFARSNRHPSLSTYTQAESIRHEAHRTQKTLRARKNAEEKEEIRDGHCDKSSGIDRAGRFPDRRSFESPTTLTTTPGAYAPSRGDPAGLARVPANGAGAGTGGGKAVYPRGGRAPRGRLQSHVAPGRGADSCRPIAPEAGRALSQSHARLYGRRDSGRLDQRRKTRILRRTDDSDGGKTR